MEMGLLPASKGSLGTRSKISWRFGRNLELFWVSQTAAFCFDNLNSVKRFALDTFDRGSGKGKGGNTNVANSGHKD